jgi:hypothetical protein
MPMRHTLQAILHAYYGCDCCGVVFVVMRPACMPADERRTVVLKWNTAG